MTIKLVVLHNNQVLITGIEEIGADIGEPDCKLISPFVIHKDETLTPWISDFTNESEFMISSEKILTLTDPKSSLLQKYQNLIK